MAIAKSCAAVVWMENSLLVVSGGSSNGSVMDSVECLNLSTNRPTWRNMPSMQLARYAHGMTLVADKVVVAGGQSVNGYEETSVEVFVPQGNNMQAGQWTFISPLTRSLDDVKLVLWRGRIFAFGELYLSQDLRSLNPHKTYKLFSSFLR